MDNNRFTTIYLVRHGETEWNVKNLIQGHSDSPLTDKGIGQALNLGRKLQHTDFDAIFSSDLLRAKRTAELLKLERKLIINTSRLLRERFFDQLEGKSWEDIKNEQKEIFDKLESLSEKEKKLFKYTPQAESDDEILGRMITFLREISVVYINKTVLVVSHGGILRTFLNHSAPELIKNKKLGNGAYIKLRSDGVDFFIDEIEGLIEKV